MGDPTKRVQRAEAEAAAWHARLGEPRVATETIQDFFAWRTDPANAKAYDRVQKVWRQAKTLQGRPAMTAALTAALERRRDRERRPIALGFGLAAVGALLAGAIGLGLWREARPTAATAVGEQRLMQLADGSSVRLDTASAIRVRFSGERRLVELEKGQAFFDVARDPARPFVVRDGAASVTALGTAFDVRRSPEGLRVILVSGAVEVRNAASAAPRRLAAGQQAVIRDGAPVVTKVDVEQATSWTQGRVVFRDTPLAAAVAEVNRYLDRPVVLDAPHLARAPVNGVFRIGDRDAFVSAAAEVFDLKAEPRADGGVRLAADTK